MRFRRHLELERGQKEINITPLVDMVFLLLIFFMLTSSFVVVPGIKINLPKAVTSEVVQENQVIITVGRDRAIFLNDMPITLDELQKQLPAQAGEPRKPILIKADTAVALGTVVTIWDICRRIGITQINIATLQDRPE